MSGKARLILVAIVAALGGGAGFGLWQVMGPRTVEVASTLPAISVPSGPTFDLVRVGQHGDLMVAGRASPGADVIVMDGDQEIGRVRANGSGEWIFAPDTPLPSGRHKLSLKARLGDGRVENSAAPVTALVPHRPGGIALAI